jgi:hypothetical protein
MLSFSQRFQRPVAITRHAAARAEERGVGETVILEVLESGTIKDKDTKRKWIYKDIPDRSDNLICLAVVVEEAVVVKTVMIHWRVIEA